jgi:hypothetical protein
MVTQVVETGARPTQPAPHQNKKLLSKIAYILGLGCCMNERQSSLKKSGNNVPVTSLEKLEANNWSTSTLAFETDLNLANPGFQDARDVPLTSMEFFAASPAPPPYVARPQSRPRKQSRRRSDSPVRTISDPDIATGTSSSKTTKSQKPKKEKISSLAAWSQIDPTYSMYQQDHSTRQQRQNALGQKKKGHFDDVRAFDFMSYGMFCPTAVVEEPGLMMLL